MRRVIAGGAAVLVAVALVLLAVGYKGLGDPEGAPAGTIVLTDSGIRAPREGLRTGQEVVLRNEGKAVHALSFLGRVRVSKPPLGPGREVRTRVPSKQGFYRLVDPIRNHEQIGVVGNVRLRKRAQPGG